MRRPLANNQRRTNGQRPPLCSFRPARQIFFLLRCQAIDLRAANTDEAATGPCPYALDPDRGARRPLASLTQRAEQAYEQQNRGQIYSQQSQVNMPYSANYVPDVPNRGLSDVFAHDRMVSNCVRNTGTGAGRAPPPPSSAN